MLNTTTGATLLPTVGKIYDNICYYVNNKYCHASCPMTLFQLLNTFVFLYVISSIFFIRERYNTNVLWNKFFAKQSMALEQDIFLEK